MPKTFAQSLTFILIAFSANFAAPLSNADTSTTKSPAPLFLSYKKGSPDIAEQKSFGGIAIAPPVSVEFRGLLSLSPNEQVFPITISTNQPNFLLCKSSYYRTPIINEQGLKVDDETQCRREVLITNAKEISGVRIAPAGNFAKTLAAAAALDLQRIDPSRYRALTSPMVGRKLSEEIANVLLAQSEKASLESSLTVKAGGKTYTVKFVSEIAKRKANYEHIDFEYASITPITSAEKLDCSKSPTDPVTKEFCRRQPFHELIPRIERFLDSDWAKDQSADPKLANVIDNEGLTVGMRLVRRICVPQAKSEDSGFSAGEDEITPKKAKAIESLFRAAKEDYRDALGRTLKFYAAYYGCELDLNKLGKSSKDSAGVPIFLYALAGKNQNSIKATWTKDAKNYLKDPPPQKQAAVVSQGGVPSLSEISILGLLFKSNSPEAVENFSSMTERNQKNLRYFNEASGLANSLNPEAFAFLKKLKISLWTNKFGNKQHVVAHALTNRMKRKTESAFFTKIEKEFANGPEGIITVCNESHNPEQCLLENNFCSPIKDRLKKVKCLQNTGQSDELQIGGEEWKIAGLQPNRSEDFCAPVKAKEYEYSACLLKHVSNLPSQKAESHLKKLLSHPEGATLFFNELAFQSISSLSKNSKNVADICLSSPYSFKTVKTKSGRSGFIADMCIEILRRSPVQEFVARSAACNKSGGSKECVIPLLLSPISDSVTGLRRLCDQNDPLACSRIAQAPQGITREAALDAAKKVCALSEYTLFCEMGFLNDPNSIPKNTLIHIARNRPAFGPILYQRLKEKSVSITEIDSYAADFERTCTESAGSCQLANFIYQTKNDSAGLERIADAALERCRDLFQCQSINELITKSPRHIKLARELCSTGKIGLCESLRNNSLLEMMRIPYAESMAFCATLQSGYRDGCLSTVLSFIEKSREEAKDFCLTNDKFRTCSAVYIEVSSHKLSPQDLAAYENFCSSNSRPGACIVLAHYYLKSDKGRATEYLQQSCVKSGYFPTICERSLDILSEKKMKAEVQTFFKNICGLPPMPGICASRTYYRLKASDSPDDKKALENECNAKNRKSCLNLAKYYKEKGNDEKSAILIKELCENSSDKSGCPGFPSFFGPY